MPLAEKTVPLTEAMLLAVCFLSKDFNRRNKREKKKMRENAASDNQQLLPFNISVNVIIFMQKVDAICCALNNFTSCIPRNWWSAILE